MINEHICKAGIINSETLPECSNEQLIPFGNNGPFVGKIPVVLAEPVVQVDVESVIQLEEPAFEIKRIKKNVFITQCKVISTGCDNTGKLFLSGFVRKNIEYATAECCNENTSSISGKIRHTTVNVPFRCVTKIRFIVPPQIHEKAFTKEMASFVDCMEGHDFCNQKIIGHSPCEQTFNHVEIFNEKIFCELEETKIFEDDILMDPKPIGCECNHEFTFDRITEKMVIFIRLKLLQKQQVNIK